MCFPVEITPAKRSKCWAKHVRNRENKKIRKLLARASANPSFIIDFKKLNLDKQSFKLRVRRLVNTQVHDTQPLPSSSSPSPPSYSPISSLERVHSPSPEPQPSRNLTPPPSSGYSPVFSEFQQPPRNPTPPPPFDYPPSLDHQPLRIPTSPSSSRLESSNLPGASHNFEEALQDFAEELPDFKEEPEDLEQGSFDPEKESGSLFEDQDRESWYRYLLNQFPLYPVPLTDEDYRVGPI